MVGFLGAHGTEDGHSIHLFGDLGEVLADFDAGDGRFDFLEGTAVGVAGLKIEGVHLAGSAVHPEQDARALAFRVRSAGGGKVFQPAGQRVTDDASGYEAVLSRREILLRWVMMVDSKVRVFGNNYSGIMDRGRGRVLPTPASDPMVYRRSPGVGVPTPATVDVISSERF